MLIQINETVKVRSASYQYHTTSKAVSLFCYDIGFRGNMKRETFTETQVDHSIDAILGARPTNGIFRKSKTMLKAIGHRTETVHGKK